jgi:hypothetical protein
MDGKEGFAFFTPPERGVQLQTVAGSAVSGNGLREFLTFMCHRPHYQQGTRT